ncbi:MAG: DUF2283 domain-containing protein, partial [Methanobrevibacter sp.]|nr:DUF2283 domain-containing protein [Candidatus Methanoflexus mossambicus]
KEDYNYEISLELAEGIIMDFDKNNNPIGLEILDASKFFKVPSKQYLSNFNSVNMTVKITEKTICVALKVGFNVHHKQEFSLNDVLTINNINAPIMETSMVIA